MKLFVKTISISLLALFIFAIGIGAGYLLRDYIIKDQPSDMASEDIGLYWEVWNRVEEQFYGGVPEGSNVTYGAIKGSLSVLDDPYTIFLEPEPAAQEKASLEGQFGGIGAFVRRDEAGRVILEPMREQAAEQAGLQTDDVLIGIDDTEITPEMTTDEIVALIRGEVGTEVILTVEREGETEPVKLTVVRAIIQTPSVTWRILEEDPTIGYIQMTSFTERTSAELSQALDDLLEQDAKTFVFDLRRNGGGLLDTAIDVASEFLRDGVVLKEDRQNEGQRVYDVRGGGQLLDQPLVVLVDGGTASASEIVAGALQDYGRATLIGEKTFGKGSVQLIYELSDRSRLHVTVAKWFTPNGNLIDGVGLKPDVEVLFSEEDHQTGRDPQLERAISFLQNEEYAKKSSKK
ncbi:MAG: S41 family peptidase [Anaerolineae bacterium]|nr:S41 family peptidase [Anaerolineae bacterium]MCB0178056.1 S41 family peptidase [Anaerolineae bacterium]MCB9107162.1 S41 family peptidase [Anaerolineales bacterium]